MTPGSDPKEGGAVFMHVTAFFVVSSMLLMISGVSPSVAIALLLLTVALVAVFTKAVFTQSRRVGTVALIATWALVFGCVVVNFAGLYFDDAQATPASFTGTLSRTEALELSLGTLAPGGLATASPRSQDASLEHALEAVFAVAALGLPGGGLVVALQQKTPS